MAAQHDTMISVRIRKQLGAMAIEAIFDAPAAGITVLYGPSGAGKTSILNMLAGLLRPDSGSIWIGNQVLFDSRRKIHVPPNRRQVGYIFQDKRLFPFLSVRRNLEFGSSTQNRTGTPRLEDTVDLLGIGHLLDRKPHTLSGGEGQRVAIGRALLSGPDLLLMDEPFSSLDDERKNELIPYVDAIPDTFGIPVILVTHSPRELEQLSDRVVFVREGKCA